MRLPLHSNFFLIRYSDLWHEERESPLDPQHILQTLGNTNQYELPYRRLIDTLTQKKGAQAQKQVALIKSQASQAKTPEQKKAAAEKEAREKEKAASEAAKREMAELFKPVQVQKVPFGVDPKTVLCVFYKQGNCENLYQDTREGEDEAKRKDDMADWDEEKLRQVVLSKHGNPKTTTDKVCKFFVDAVENGKYGWFWTCPNGGDKCMYKHSLPPGYVPQLSPLQTVICL
jgi:hypothetical protein